MKQMTLVRFSVEQFLKVNSSIFFFFYIKYEIANALPVVDTVRYYNGTVSHRVTKSEIAPPPRG